MRKTVLMGLAAIAACLMLFVPVSAQEAAPQAGCCDVGCCDGAGCYDDACGGGGCCCSSGIVIGAELLYLDVFAKQGAGGDIFSDAMADYDYEASFRLWAGYQFSNCLGIRFRYFTYDADGEWHEPELDGIVVFNGEGYGEQSLEIDMYDIELTDNLCIGCWELAPSIGVRWGEVELSDNFITQEVCGVGAVAGLDARRSIRGCWSVYANGRYGVLYGDMDWDYADVNTVDGIRIIGLGGDDTFFETIEMQVGVEWARCCGTGNLFARAGWEQQVYLVDDMLYGGFRGDTGDISLAGPAFAIGLDR